MRAPQLQAASFFERLTAREQPRTFGSLYGAPGDKADAMLAGLTDKADTCGEKLSGGQAQRLSIACALVHEPELVFLDEPTARPGARLGRHVRRVHHARDMADEGHPAPPPPLPGPDPRGWALSFLAIGMLIGAWAKSQEAAQGVTQMVVLPMAFLGGSFFPIDQGPGGRGWFQRSFRCGTSTGTLKVMVRGQGPASALPQMGVLLGFAPVATVIAVRVFQWDEI